MLHVNYPIIITMQFLQINITYIAVSRIKIPTDKIIARVVPMYKNIVHAKRNYLNNGSIIKCAA